MASETPEPFFTVKLPNIAAHTAYPAVVRLAAHTVMQKGYLHPGEFFKQLSDFDLVMLVDFAETMVPGTGAPEQARYAAGEILMVLSGVLALGEGDTELTAEKGTKHLASTCIFITMESLYRKGLIELEHANISYVDESLKLAKLKGAPDA